MIEFFMGKGAADRYSREVGGKVYHHSSRKYWLVADKTAYDEHFYAAHPYVVTDVDILDQVAVHRTYSIYGLLFGGEWRRIPIRSKSLEGAAERIEEYKSMMGLPGFPVYDGFKIIERSTTLRNSSVFRQVR